MDQKTNYIRMGITAFLTAAGILLFYDTLFGGKVLLALLTALSPILFGAFVAYLLAPMVNAFAPSFPCGRGGPGSAPRWPSSGP